MNKTKLALIALVALIAVILAGCSKHATQGPLTPSQKQAFGGVPDPAAQARDAAKFQAFQKRRASQAGAAGAQSPPVGGGAPAGR